MQKSAISLQKLFIINYFFKHLTFEKPSYWLDLDGRAKPMQIWLKLVQKFLGQSTEGRPQTLLSVSFYEDKIGPTFAEVAR